MPDPALPVSVEAVRELPEEIARAIEKLDEAAREAGSYSDDEWSRYTSPSVGEARDALEAAILVRLTAAEASRDVAIARVERLEKALEFYADDKNYRLNGPLDPNSSWFEGNARAVEALAAKADE